jgi:hypothetical protein
MEDARHHANAEAEIAAIIPIAQEASRAALTERKYDNKAKIWKFEWIVLGPGKGRSSPGTDSGGFAAA